MTAQYHYIRKENETKNCPFAFHTEQKQQKVTSFCLFLNECHFFQEYQMWLDSLALHSTDNNVTANCNAS